MVQNEIEAIDKPAMELVKMHYSSLPFASKPEEYWEKIQKPDNFYAHVFRWCTVLGIRKDLPDGIETEDMHRALLKDYPHLNENSVTDAIQKNLQGKYMPKIEAYNRLNMKFLFELLTAYERDLIVAHKLAVAARDKHNQPTEPTPAEIEAKNIEAMKSVFEEFKRTGNESLISSRYYDFLNSRKLIPPYGGLKKQFLIDAREELKRTKASDVNVRQADKIMKEIESGGSQDEVLLIAKKLTVIHFFNEIETLEFTCS
jgi:hypothetical protein